MKRKRAKNAVRAWDGETIAELVHIWRERDGQSLDLIFNNKRKHPALSVDMAGRGKRQRLHSMLIMQLFSLDQRFSPGIVSEHRYQNKIKKITRERAGDEKCCKFRKERKIVLHSSLNKTCKKIICFKLH